MPKIYLAILNLDIHARTMARAWIPRIPHFTRLKTLLCMANACI